MGWVANIAGALIAVMFVYNWLNKKNTSSTSNESSEDRSPSEEATSLDTPNQEDDEERESPNILVQPPAIIPPTDPVSIDHSDNKDATIETVTVSAPSQAQTMAPPPLPTVTPATSMMPPPPRPKSPPRLKPPTVGHAPTAPRPGGSSLRPPPSAASSLRVPVTKVLSNTSMAPSLSPSSLMAPPKKVSRQVVLEPGHSPLDWAALTSNPRHNLRGKDAPPNNSLIRVTPSMLKVQNGRKGSDAWTVFQGKVYNVTPYVPFHPGGKGEILRGAGKDSAKLFMEVHPWVNWDGMLGECCVGILVAEDDGKDGDGNKLDEMD